jgi:endonuclease YncB( thermonuclease family)
VTKEVIGKNRHLTIRLQGIDAPEPHYRPSAELKRTEQSTIQHNL